MSDQENTYITTRDLLFRGILNDIKKSQLALQPIFEAFTNALESIKIKSEEDKNYKGKILIKIYASETTFENTEFNSLSISDNGVGFNEKEFKRFNTFKDFTKGFKNLGSGRIQFAHYFDNTIIRSVYFEAGKLLEREFVVSKKDSFLDKNAIVYQKYCKETTKTEIDTTITFNTLLENSNIYNNLNENTLKEHLIEKYIHYFCYNKSTLPTIEIKFFVQSELKGETSIVESDIPSIDKADSIKIPYSRIASSGRAIEKLEKTEEFIIDAFKVNKDILKANNLKLVSKGEIVEESNIHLQSLAKGDHVEGFKYLFLVSSEYIDSRDTNMRGVINIPDKDSLSKNTNIFSSEEIFLEEIQEGVNSTINSMYPEIEYVQKQHIEQLERLKEMFLLDEETAIDIKISVNDSQSRILEKFYEAEAKKTASIDATIKESIDNLDRLDTTSEDYTAELQKEIEKLVKVIPIQNKTSLTHYVARRKLVLELFEKINDKQLLIQTNASRNIDEKLLHNLIFQQSNSNPLSSDLWLVNEDFIYFKGTSEDQLQAVNLNGENLLRENLTPEEEEFRISLNENRFTKRPDILLFPEEGKCIIIEFKNPDKNVSEHLTQINNYATLIWNFAKPEFRFQTYYGYLIGEKINSFDVRAHDGDFNEAYHFDYLFRPSKQIPGLFTTGNANLYTEVIKYTTLLKRAKRRNEIFINKLIKS